MILVTSFGPEGYDLYGRKFLDSFLEHKPIHTLIVYVEGADQAERVHIDYPQVIIRDLLEVPGVKKSLDEMSTNKFMQGHTQDQQGNSFHTWRLDAFRYCRKVFAFHHAITSSYIQSRRADRSVIAWIDADTVFTSRLPDKFDAIIMPASSAVAYLGRNKMHSETGFVAVDANHPKINMFLALYWGLYATGAFVDLREWHDCYVFDHARKLSMIPSHDLSTDRESLYPFDTSVLSNWMAHHKGPKRKHEAYGTETGLPEAEDDR